MKILTTYEAKNAFPKVLKLSQKDVVIVTNRGKPVAAIQGLKGEDDLEDYLLERSPKFWAMIRRARRGKSVALDQVRKELGLEKASLSPWPYGRDQAPFLSTTRFMPSGKSALIYAKHEAGYLRV